MLEINGICPLCGAYVLKNKGKRINKRYEIAHIYPNSPTNAEAKELQGLERLGINCESFENKIALCIPCHDYYDDHKTKEEYVKLLNIKKKAMNLSNAKIAVSSQDIEDDITLLIETLSKIDQTTLRKMELNYQALKISNKIEGNYFLLINKIENYVCLYFNLIKETFQNYEKSGNLNFKLIASEIKTCFLKCKNEIDVKPLIFESMVNWLKSKSINSSTEACEAVISFFVQNCEVFDEITK